MKNKNLINYGIALCFIAIILSITSCSSIKNVKYFTDIPDSGANVKLANIKFNEPVIQPDDILTVSILYKTEEGPKSLDIGNLQSSAVGNSSVNGTGGQTVSGILVDKNGDIEFPIIGKIHVAGLTTEKARELIRERTSLDYKTPSVSLRFANFKITILGEVNRPGTYVVGNEKVNILDALGLAGDLTIYGKRDNIKLIRQQANGEREVVMLDLTKKAVLNSPYYYLTQNDYIIVEPVKTKVVASDAIQNRNITITTTVISFLVSVLVVIIAKS